MIVYVLGETDGSVYVFDYDAGTGQLKEKQTVSALPPYFQGTPANEDTARDMIAKLDANQTVQNLVSAVTFLEKHANANGKAGAMGFCWGGGMVGALAVNAPDLDAGVVYYGRQPNPADVENIKAPCSCTTPGWTRASTKASRHSRTR